MQKRSFDETRGSPKEEPVSKKIKWDLARLDRCVIEQYVTQCAVNNVPPTLLQIEQLANSSARTEAERFQKRVLETTVGRASLYGEADGSDNPFFSMLPPELLCYILMFLPFRDRLTCAIAVCRPWRTLLTEPCLWSTLSLTLVLHRYSRKPILVGAKNAKRLVGMIGSHITKFGIHCDSGSTTVASLVHELNWGQLKCISLGGKSFTSPSAREISKKWTSFPELESLRFWFVPMHNAQKILFPHFLVNSPNLLSLDFQTHFVGRELAETWVELARSARQGGHPLLKTLRISGTGSNSFDIEAIRVLFEGFPELEDFSFSQLQLNSLPLVTPLSLPRLRRLSIGLGRDYQSSYTATHVYAFGNTLRTLLMAAPNLEFLEIWKPRELISGPDRKRGRVEEPPFQLDGAFCGQVVPNLRELQLSHVYVSAHEISTASFPALSTAMLRLSRVHEEILVSTSAVFEKVAPLLRLSPNVPWNNLPSNRSLEMVAGSPKAGFSGNHYY